MDKLLKLRLPERTTPPKDAPHLDPRNTEIWINELPIANIGETSHRLFRHLTNLNRLDIAPGKRIRMAEHLTAPIDYVADNLRKHYVGVSFPLPERQHKVALLVRRLYSELADAYKIIVSDIATGRTRKIDKNLLSTAIQRAIKYQIQVLYQSTLVYEPVDKGLWLDIHSVYAFAEEQGIERRAVKNGDFEHRKSCVNDLYKQAMLFSITSPFNRRQEEIEHIFRRLHEWSSLVGVRRPDTNEVVSDGGLFVDRLSLDKGPLHLDLQTKSLSPRCRIVDVTAVIDRLKEELEDRAPEDNQRLHPGQQQISRHSLQQLIDVMQSATKRRFTRTHLNFDLNTVLGLRNLHAILSIQPDTPHATTDDGSKKPPEIRREWLNDPVNSAALFAMHAENLELNGEEEGATKRKRVRKISKANYRGDDAPTWTARKTRTPMAEIVNCRTRDESSGGYCIEWPDAYRHLLKIGEMIGIQAPGDLRKFGVGVVRWIKNEPDTGMQIGIETISRDSNAALVQKAESEADTTRPEAGIIVPGIQPADDPATLLLPPYIFGIGEPIWIASEHGEHLARLTGLVEQTGAFSRFNFEYNEIEKDDSDFEDPGEGFDGIWSMI